MEVGGGVRRPRRPTVHETTCCSDRRLLLLLRPLLSRNGRALPAHLTPPTADEDSVVTVWCRMGTRRQPTNPTKDPKKKNNRVNAFPTTPRLIVRLRAAPSFARRPVWVGNPESRYLIPNPSSRWFRVGRRLLVVVLPYLLSYCCCRRRRRCLHRSSYSGPSDDDATGPWGARGRTPQDCRPTDRHHAAAVGSTRQDRPPALVLACDGPGAPLASPQSSQQQQQRARPSVRSSVPNERSTNNQPKGGPAHGHRPNRMGCNNPPAADERCGRTELRHSARGTCDATQGLSVSIERNQPYEDGRCRLRQPSITSQ
jgi:hypothetical protein